MTRFEVPLRVTATLALCYGFGTGCSGERAVLSDDVVSPPAAEEDILDITREAVHKRAQGPYLIGRWATGRAIVIRIVDVDELQFVAGTFEWCDGQELRHDQATQQVLETTYGVDFSVLPALPQWFCDDFIISANELEHAGG